MPIFAALLTGLFSSIGVFLAKIVAVKVAVRAAAVVALAALSAALVVVFNTAVTPFVQALFSTQYGQFLGLLFPPISGTVLVALMAFWLAVMAYRLQARAIALTASV